MKNLCFLIKPSLKSSWKEISDGLTTQSKKLIPIENTQNDVLIAAEEKLRNDEDAIFHLLFFPLFFLHVFME